MENLVEDNGICDCHYLLTMRLALQKEVDSPFGINSIYDLVRSRRCSAAHLFPCTRCTHLTTCDRTTGADVYSTDADWCGEFEEA